ncbi:BlaI/MecI/CopY family transcriptional regulator [Kitasatospora sp. NPDC088391]|uniref:BlaI/MecI/CopY family transcriptional regulator n=1 Tax=Kitasatospora sp. NPDC088391 TaxID=3364074 RepID=UPI003829B28A
MELAGRGEGEQGEDGARRRRGQGELATEVLSVLHRAPGPVTASWVQEQVGGDLAYTTVMTILSRLLAKQAVVRSRAGRAYVWSAAADAAGLTARRMRRMLDTEPDRDAVLASFVTALTPQDERLLRSLLNPEPPESAERPGGGGRGGR